MSGAIAETDVYMGVPVPGDIRMAWHRWEACRWRVQVYHSTNRLYAPDQRFTVRMPGGMCEVHRKMWSGYRNMLFDPRRGYRWPGTPVLEWSVIPTAHIWDERRVEWDERSSEQMKLIEECCLSGRSAQCEGARTCWECALLRPTPEFTAWLDTPLPSGATREGRRALRCACPDSLTPVKPPGKLTV